MITTGSTGSTLEQKFGLQVEIKVSSGPLGGDQEIGGYIAQKKVGAVIFFKDPLSAHAHDSDIGALGRLCDVHNLLVATNPASSHALVHFIKMNSDQVVTMSSDDSKAVKAYKQEQSIVMSKVVVGG